MKRYSPKALLRPLMVLTVTFLSHMALAQWREEPVYRFTGVNGDGVGPLAALVADAAGNLYGTTNAGGATKCSCGTVFELSPPSGPGGAWIETVIHTFNSRPDGASPYGSLVFDAVGNLYGTTDRGGTSGSGTVFELSPTAVPGAPWSENILYNFTGGADGGNPTSNLIFDRAGNLYGTTTFGGGQFLGTVFELSPPGQSGGTWTETVLYSFLGSAQGDGAVPSGGVVFDMAGNLYGATASGGTGSCPEGCGTVFQLSRSGGAWVERNLHSFTAAGDGNQPVGGLILSKGAIYGATYYGGSKGCSGVGCGTVYQIARGTYTVIDRFVENTSEGIFPKAGVTADQLGNLYGTTSTGGGNPYCLENSCGAVYELSPPSQSGGRWKETTLYDFSDFNGDGAFPDAALVFYRGVAYGTTPNGGDGNCSFNQNIGCGTVFAIAP